MINFRPPHIAILMLLLTTQPISAFGRRAHLVSKIPASTTALRSHVRLMIQDRRLSQRAMSIANRIGYIPWRVPSYCEAKAFLLNAELFLADIPSWVAYLGKGKTDLRPPSMPDITWRNHVATRVGNRMIDPTFSQQPLKLNQWLVQSGTVNEDLAQLDFVYAPSHTYWGPNPYMRTLPITDPNRPGHRPSGVSLVPGQFDATDFFQAFSDLMYAWAAQPHNDEQLDLNLHNLANHVVRILNHMNQKGALHVNEAHIRDRSAWTSPPWARIKLNYFSPTQQFYVDAL